MERAERRGGQNVLRTDSVPDSGKGATSQDDPRSEGMRFEGKQGHEGAVGLKVVEMSFRFRLVDRNVWTT